MLTTDEGARLLEAVLGIDTPGPADVVRLRALADADRVSAAIRLAQGRRKAALKFARGHQMWVDPIGVEQCTSEAVARHKARRFGTGLVVDLCSGVGGDALALAERGDVIAVDLDHAMCRRLNFNAAVYEASPRLLAARSRAEKFVIPDRAWVHLDPDRRIDRRQRARLLEDYAPGPEFWNSLIDRVEAGAIKLGPASDFARHLPDSKFEVELISLRGECKEATGWFGSLRSCRRRATRLPENVTWTDRDGPAGEFAPIIPLGRFIHDTDSALSRSGLVDGFALACQLGRIAEGVDYLSGDSQISTPFLSSFEVIDQSPLDLKHLKRLAARYELGTFEIKVRGVDIKPESLRARLGRHGEKSATLLIVGGPGAARVVLAQKASTGGSMGSSIDSGGGGG